MFKAANDDRPLSDPDDIDEMRRAASWARVMHDADRYVGNPNLLNLAISTALEIRRENQEFVAIAERDSRSQAERRLANVEWRAVLARIRSLERELAAMIAAMGDATRASFDAALDTLPTQE